MSLIDIFRKTIPLFTAVGDINRQDIIILLAKYKQMGVNEITENMPLSRPAVSHHLKILHACGLLSIERRGRERIYRLDLESSASQLRDLLEGMEASECIKRKKL